MKDDNFLKENNARHLWHPMGHPGDAQINAPKIIKGADGAHITDIDGHRVVDAVGGLWCVNLGYSNDVVKDAIAGQLYQLPYYSAFAGTSNPTAIEASYDNAHDMALEPADQTLTHPSKHLRGKPILATSALQIGRKQAQSNH